jgi:hypothetical protein
MNEQNTQGGMGGKGVCSTCGASMSNGCHGCGHMKYHVLRWALGLIIILVVFWVGLKIGEFKGQFEGQWGGYGHRGMMIQYGAPNMIYRTTGTATTGTTVAPAPATSVTH